MALNSTMNMAGVNPAAGGPVGGMLMNNGLAAGPSSDTQSNVKRQLETYIYDYFLKSGYHEQARAFLRDDNSTIETNPHSKHSPSRRRDTEMNGVDENAMDADSGSGSKVPDDLPLSSLPDLSSRGLLFDWFSLFSEIFVASRNKKENDGSLAAQYLQQTQMMQRMRENQQSNNMMNRQGMMPNRQFGPQNMRNGMTQEMQRAMAAKNMTPAQIQQLQQHQKQMMQQMQREQSENEMNGHRPQSPASTDNAGSPSKRPRLDGQSFPGGPMAPNGRGQNGPQQQQAMNMLMANGMNGMNGRAMSQTQLQNFQAAQNNPGMQKNLQVYAHQLAQQQQGRAVMNQGVSMPNGMMNPGMMPNQGSPMLGPVDGQAFMGNISMETLYQNPQQMAALRQQANMSGPNGQGGNHALQDYQMQLMLLEQQNKKRLMMARQEQDNMVRDAGPPIQGQPGMPPQGMSPGSRAGTSPNPTDQMKRGTPQLGANGIPASPSAGDGMPQARGSPAGMNFAPGMPQDFNNQMFMKNQMDGMGGQGVPGAPGMRPPTSMNSGMNMEALARQQGGRIPSGGWQGNGQPPTMIPQGQQAQPQAMGTPQQRTMPPPSAPAAANGTNQRNPPTSSPPGQAPPTPSQTNKANPKTKKDKGESKKRPNKKNSTANAPAAAEADPPATPTPSTPITPVNPASFNKASNAPANANVPAAASSTPASNSSTAQQPAESVPTATSTNLYDSFPSEPLNLDFALEGDNVLQNFDFDTFLHNDDSEGTFAFDPAMGFEPLETGGLE